MREIAEPRYCPRMIRVALGFPVHMSHISLPAEDAFKRSRAWREGGGAQQRLVVAAAAARRSWQSDRVFGSVQHIRIQGNNSKSTARTVMASPSSCFHVLLLLLSGQVIRVVLSMAVGINYGQIANDLPSPGRVASLLHSLNISRVKLYDADQNVLSAFLNTDVEFVIGIGNENVSAMTDPAAALGWLEQHVLPYLPYTKITCIAVGNEVFKGNDTTLMADLLPAMESVHQGLVSLSLETKVNVTSAHSLDMLGNSYPPSAGSFRQDLAVFIQPILNFHSVTKSPFLINAYPYFAYKANPNAVSLDYVLFEPNSGVVDPNTNLNYDNMLYAQIDAVYSAIRTWGHADIEVRISETGWPSRGDSDEVGATPENAARYNGNLLQRIGMSEGTPLKPTVPVDIYVFALFNEDLKPGPTSERNYGLFYPDGTPVYNVGLHGYLPPMSASSSSSLRSGMMMPGLRPFVFVVAALILAWK
ncbi:glucan endo-1,3-beta-glucosidase 14-like isoform X2 [Musa acuminata AAA Group]|uniref:glucan endo-1,3-beta-glucosidase 14-like isoform X2 n=1 Tax=Musa acuminata AAA Group TaxID=214697 RepID=UPI0031DB3681